MNEEWLKGHLPEVKYLEHTMIQQVQMPIELKLKEDLHQSSSQWLPIEDSQLNQKQKQHHKELVLLLTQTHPL